MVLFKGDSFVVDTVRILARQKLGLDIQLIDQYYEESISSKGAVIFIRDGLARL